MYLIDRRINKNVFTAVKIQVVFASIDVICLLWFATHPDLFRKLLVSPLAHKYHDTILCIGAYCVNIIMFIFTITGIFFASYRNFGSLKYINRYLIAPLQKVNQLFFWTTIYGLGVFTYLYCVESMGGLERIWLEMYLFGEKSKGLGVFLSLYTNFLYISGGALFCYLYGKGHKFTSFLFVIITAILLVSLGHRAQLATFTLVIAMMWHYKIKPFKNLLNARNLIFGLFLLTFMSIFVSVRGQEFDDSFSLKNTISFEEKISGDIFMRLTNIERSIVTLGYFRDQSLWWGSSYLGILQGYKSSATFDAKAPLDSGCYLRAIAEGAIIYPPVPLKDLPSETSWPEGNLAGYMNFHLPGLVILCLLSGFIFGYLYNMVIYSQYSIGAIYLFGMFAYMGAPSLSPLGVVRLMTFLLIYFILAFASIIFNINFFRSSTK